MTWNTNNNINKYFLDNSVFQEVFCAKATIKKLNSSEINISMARLICKRVAELMPNASFTQQ